MMTLMMTPTAFAQPTQQQSSVSSGVPILSHSLSRTPFGSTYIAGEVRNDLPDVVESVQIVGRFYDADGSLIDTGNTFEWEFGQLRPGEKKPFKVFATL
jgi:hypothetical protein